MLEKLFNKYKQRKLYVAAWVDGKNYGDDYLSETITRFLNKKYKKYKIIQATLDLKKCKINKNDVVLLAGGGLWGPSGTGCLEENLYSIWTNTKAKLIVANMGIESFDPIYSKQLIKFIKKADLISFRDKKSFLIAKGVSKDASLIWGADNTFLNTINVTRNPIPKCIGINLCGPETENHIKKYSMDNITENISKLKDYGYSIKSTVFSYGETSSDYNYCKEIDSECLKEFSIRPYENCEIFIGMRFHSIVLALQNNIPVIAINYSDKVKRIMEEYELGDFCIEPEAAYNFNTIFSLINKVSESKVIITEKICTGNTNSKNRLSKFEYELDQILKHTI